MDELLGEAARRSEAGGFREARDLAIVELFYSTGMRLAELAGLNDADLDLVADQVKVRGKGRKERLLPVGRLAGAAVRAYVERARR
jgi:integrase/recombinase XerC